MLFRLDVYIDAVSLKVFLATLAIGPVTVTPEYWLLQVACDDLEVSMAEFSAIKVLQKEKPWICPIAREPQES